MAVNDHHNYLFLFSMFIFCFYSCRCEKVTASPKLVKKEVDALKEIAKGLGKKNWNFSYDPCSGEGNWILPNATKGFESFVTCDCSFATSTFCRVVSFRVLKAQNLTGILPPQIARLRFLKHLDLTRNLLKGAVPSQWTTLPLLEL
ncbi:hypothetical protein ZOSMA_76G00170 [Zostera marina]|uniref:Uncharacterized protein n=1 Tax=Zostera marina TaxID=29655 RepID=A0A0K9NNX2_ZOSMR|nr:hypothetical protein ZOSMA_76G00170 [Zostera marina]